MIGRVVSTEAVGKPARWIVCFRRKADHPLVAWLAFGTYKHVAAFGYVEDLDAWVFYERRLFHTDIWVGRGAGARHMMAQYIDGADMLGMPVNPRGSLSLFGFWCVPAVKHLIGLRSGALRVDALYRDCLAAGAEIIDESQRAAGCPDT